MSGTPDAYAVEKEIENEYEGLEGRMAKCDEGFCQTTTESSWDFAFFSYNPDKEMNSYYCGCRGWN